MDKLGEQKLRDEVDTVGAYRQCFFIDGKLSKAGQAVLQDIAEFSGIESLEHEGNPDKALGRMETYNHINRTLEFSGLALRHNKGIIDSIDIERGLSDE